MIEYFNGIAIIAEDSHISKWVKESNRLDHDQNVLPRVIPFIPKDGIVIDAGSFIGDHTIAYANKVGELGIVLAFEPFKEAFDCLRHNLKDYNFVVCDNTALGKKKGYVTPKAISENFGMSIVEESKSGTKIDTLDNYIKSLNYEFPQLDFYKIDCEGMEIDILQGSKETIEKFKPVMLIEVNEHTLKAKGYTKNDLLQTIHDLGYTYRNVYEEQGLDEEQFDVLCFPI